QNIDVGALRDPFEKVSGNKLHAWQAARGRGRWQTGGEIKQHTGKVRVARGDVRQEQPVTAAPVHNTRKRAEIVSFGDGFVAALVERHHGALEQGSLFGMVSQPVESRLSEHLVESR